MDMVDDIHITWFGGEPLLELDRIVSLSSELMRLAKKHGIGYTSDMITNGSLANHAIVRKLVEQCGITQVQITLDGRGDEYLHRKAYLSEDVTFDTIMETMDSFVEYGAQLLIRLNIDKDNYEDCLRLIPLLGERYNNLESVMLYAAPLYGTSDCSSFFTEEELNDAYRAVFRSMIDAGLIQTLDGLPLNFNNATCSAQMINNFIITPTGDVFKCEHLLTDENQRVGTVFDGILFNEAMARWASPDIPKKCREYRFLPSCQAGCFAAEALQFGLKRCPHIAYITDAIIDAAGYLLDNHGERTER